MLSTSISNVAISSKFSFEFPRVFFKHLLTLLTKRSQIPPHQGATAMLNFHSINLLAAKDCVSCEVNTDALSDNINEGHDLRAINLRRLLIKAFDDADETNPTPVPLLLHTYITRRTLYANLNPC